MGKEIEYNCKK